ncbi:MAG: hypothetical protein ACT4OX_03745 [Actinomycetota bacterium]
MPSRFAARAALAFGFFAASVAYGCWIAQRTALDPGATGEVARALLESPPVRDALQDQIADQIRAANYQAEDAELDPQTLAAIETAVVDPRFVNAFADGLTEIHRQLLSGSSGQLTLDVNSVTAAVQESLAEFDPALADQLAAQPLQIDLGDARLPQLGDARSRARSTMVVALACALLLLASGVALAERTRDALARIGRRLALLGLSPILVFVVAPWGLASFGDGGTVAADVLGVYRGRVIPSVVALIVAGIGLWIGARVWPADAVGTPKPGERPRARTRGIPGLTRPNIPVGPRRTPGERPTERLYL